MLFQRGKDQHNGSLCWFGPFVQTLSNQQPMLPSVDLWCREFDTRPPEETWPFAPGASAQYLPIFLRQATRDLIHSPASSLYLHVFFNRPPPRHMPACWPPDQPAATMRSHTRYHQSPRQPPVLYPSCATACVQLVPAWWRSSPLRAHLLLGTGRDPGSNSWGDTVRGPTACVLWRLRTPRTHRSGSSRCDQPCRCIVVVHPPISCLF